MSLSYRVEKICNMKDIKILIADDHEVIHRGVEDILKSYSHYKIIAHAYHGKEAVSMARDLHPDIIFMDISMPEMTGIEACMLLSAEEPGIKIIALTQFEDNEYVAHFLKAGGKGYLLKNSRKEEFVNAIESVLMDKRYLSYELSNSILEQILDPDPSKEKSSIHLTRREIEIIRKISEDKSNIEIADELVISLRTVETHRRNIMQKLDAKSVVSILKYAAKHNLIDL